MDRGLTQQQVADQIGVNRNFVYEWEQNNRTNTIYALHKIYLFLGYIPKTLKLKEKLLKDRLLIYRIHYGLSQKQFGKKIGINGSTVGRIEKDNSVKEHTLEKLSIFIDEKLHNQNYERN